MDTTYSYRFGTAEFNQGRFELTVEGQRVIIEKRPLQLLSVLLSHAGEVVTKDELLDSVWQQKETGEGALTNAISRLRSGLGKENASFIVTKPRVGYLFSGKLERIALSSSDVSCSGLSPDMPVPGKKEFILEALLSVSDKSQREVWLARPVSRQQKTKHVFKFSSTAEGLRQLKREYTLSNLLQQSDTLVDSVSVVCGCNFESPPFFIESLYAGPDLLRWSQEGDQLVKMSRHGRLQLFLKIASTVAVAHNLGVLHKDIKPANILITEDLNSQIQPRLTDFGSSHLLQPNVLADMGISPLGLTQTLDELPSSRSGSLLYIAPEVWDGKMHSIQSDVYALGVLLYQMSTGNLAQGMPADWSSQLDDDFLVEDIALATATDLSERLETVSELTDRLTRLDQRRSAQASEQAREALAARHQAALDRSRTRRPWLIAAAASLLVGMATTAFMYQEARLSRETALQNEQKATAISQFWKEEIIDSADPYKNDTATLSEVLSRASQRVSQVFDDNLEVAGQIHLSLGEAFDSRSDYSQALESFQYAQKIFSAAYGPESEQVWTAKLMQGRSLILLGKSDELKALLADYETSANVPHSDQTNYLFLANKAYLSEHKQQWAQAAGILEEAALLVPKIDLTYKKVVGLFTTLSSQYSVIRQFDDAENALNKIPVPRSELPVVLQNQIDLARATIYLDKDDYDKAEPLLLSIYESLKTSAGDDARDTLRTASLLATLYTWKGQMADALPFARETYEIAQSVRNANSPDTIASRAQYGLVLHYTGDNARAIEILTSAAAEIEEHIGADSAYLHMVYYYLAQALSSEGAYEESLNSLANINEELFVMAMGSTDSLPMIEMLTALNNWKLSGTDMDVIEQLWPVIKGCDCSLYPLVASLIEEPARYSEAP